MSKLAKYPIDENDLKPLGKTGEKIPAIGMGTWGIRSYADAEEVLVSAVERGLWLIDTAEMYGEGLAEELVGRVVRRVGRDRVFIVTKLRPYRFASPDSAIKAAEASCRRMGVNYVDLLLIHWPEETLPIHVQIKSLEAIAEKGLTRYIGVSNFSAEQLREAVESTSKFDIVLNQVKYSVLDKKVERKLLPTCIELGITLQAYTSIERGRVAYDPRVIEVAQAIGKTPIQVALNYVISRPMTVALVKTERMDHLEEILGALGWRLSNELIERLEKI